MALRVAIAGGDGFMNTVLRAFVDLSAKKPKGWQVLVYVGGMELICRSLSSF